LLEKVVQRELPLEKLARVLLGLVLVDDRLEVLHEPHDIAKPENSFRHSIRAELLELVEPLSKSHESDGHLRDFLDRKSRPSSCITVELRQGDSRKTEPFVKGCGGFDGVLTNHCVDDEQDVLGLNALPDLFELPHERFVDCETASRIINDGVVAVLARVDQ